ncbi:MAG: NAD(P)/FAD-dependent oxidoreductase [Pseudomonadota bacterium]
MQTDILIIGGGLCGLSLAEQLHTAGRDVVLAEARDRFGGRIKTGRVADQTFDLGPAWFWPGQPRIASLIQRLGLEAFDQFAQGDLLFEDQAGRVQRGRGFASMQGSLRLKGGLDALTERLAVSLPKESTLRGTPISHLAQTPDGIRALASNGTAITAQKVVLALPPRLAAQTITFAPDLPQSAIDAMRAIPTWMAGQAKAVAVYDSPFWRQAGLSGDASSRYGPMVEIHDASPADGGPFALFGFIGVAPEQRTDAALLRQHICAQLARLFGPQAQEPRKLLLKDWAQDKHTATTEDQAPLFAHPHYGLPSAVQNLWNGALILSGSETSATFGGFLEGALDAAEIALNSVETE